MSFFEQPLFNFWFVRLSARQVIVVILSAIISYVLASGLAFLGMMGCFFVGLLSFGLLTGVFVPHRTFTSEWIILHAMQRALARRKAKRIAPVKPRAEERQHPLSGEPGQPMKIVGKLTDASGRPLPNTKFFVDVDAQPYYEGVTDEEGGYSITFVPPGPGLYTLSFKQAGAKAESSRIKLRVGQVRESMTEKPKPVSRATAQPRVSEAEEAVEGDRYIYELVPSNYLMLGDKDQADLVDGFASFLNSLEKEIKIHIVRTAKKVDIYNTSISTEYMRFFVESREPIDYILDGVGITYQRVLSVPVPRVVSVQSGAVALEGGTLCKTVMITALPATVVEGMCLSDLYPYANHITITVRPLPQHEAVRRANRFTLQLSGILYAEASRMRTPPEEINQQVQAARELLQNLISGNTKLYEFSVNISMFGRDLNELRLKEKSLKAACSAKLITVSAVRYFQDELFTGKLSRLLYGDTATVAAFYPFVSNEVIETPGGIFLGLNQITGGPVIFDPCIRENTNIAILGKSGSGKSYASKIMLRRLVEQYPSAAFFVIDPESEYVLPMSQLCPGTVVRAITPDTQIGMDPLRVFSGDKSRAIGVLVSLLHISPDKDPDLYTELRAKAAVAESIQDLRKTASARLKKYIDALVKGPDGFLVNGKPLELSERMVFDLSALHTGLGLPSEFTSLNAACLLLFGMIWNYIQNLPVQQLKIVVLDELWLYMTSPASAQFVAQLSRRGRKRNVLFFFNSQRPADVLSNEAGCTALENAATKILFNQDEAAMPLLTQRFVLSDIERHLLTELSVGECLLTSRGTRARVRFLATVDEHALYTTKPKEME